MKRRLAAIFTALALLGAGQASANPSLVKFSTNGTGSYNITQIQQFDWQSSGDLVIVDALPVPAKAGGPNGQTVTTFTAWNAAAITGDTITFNLHAHARLNAMLGTGGGDISPLTLSKDGATCLAGSGCFEITSAISGTESATMIAPGVLQWNSVTSNYKFYIGPPNSNVAGPSNVSPTSFTDTNTGGVAFLEGTSVAVNGSFLFGPPPNGNSLTSNTVSSYNANYIQTDTPGLVEINASSFDTQIKLAGSLEAIINVNQPIGLPTPYVVLQADGRLKADANSQFGALPAQPLGACRVTGGGNDVDENLIIANNANKAFTANETLYGNYAFNSSLADRYTYGGQVGAPSLLATAGGPFGEWTHHQEAGQTDDFVFHAGSHSAPSDTRITAVVCSDPRACQPAAANAGFKQIDFEGTGSFRSLKKGGTVDGYPVVTDSGGGGTRHYFRVHIEDLGEPGGSGGPKPNSCKHVPGTIIGDNKGVLKAACTSCPDIYQIEIHATADRTSPVIYTVGAYVDGGNLQIHPPVGH